MTVPTSDNREQYQGNDSATEFDYAFKIFKADDLVVTLTDSDDNESTLTRGTDYSVDGVGNENGGTVTYPLSGDPLATGETLTILREIPVVQETDLRNQGRYYPETLEDEFDRSRMIDQQQQEQLGRTLSRTRASDYFDAKGRRIANLGNAVKDQDAYTKGQADARFANDVITQTGGEWDAKSDPMGNLGNPQDPDHATTKAYVDGRFDTDVITKTGTHWDAELQQIRNLQTRQPPSSTDAMNFGAVSQHVSDVLNSADPQTDGWQRVRWVNTIADLQALPTSELVDGQVFQAHAERYRYTNQDVSAHVAQDPRRLIWIPVASDSSGASGAFERLLTKWRYQDDMDKSKRLADQLIGRGASVSASYVTREGGNINVISVRGVFGSQFSLGEDGDGLTRISSGITGRYGDTITESGSKETVTLGWSHFAGSEPNVATVTVGDTFTGSFTGKGVLFHHFGDSRGGVWEFNINNGARIVRVSTYRASASDNVVALATDLDNGDHNFTATFLGADPAVDYGSENPRGWLKYRSEEDITLTPLLATPGLETSKSAPIVYRFGPHVTSLPNSYTTEVGAGFMWPFSGTGFILNAFGDTRGGLWEFVVDGVQTKQVSVYRDAVTDINEVVFDDLADGQHEVVATFLGADPANPPSATARGWYKYADDYRNPLTITTLPMVTGNRTSILSGGIQEWAIRCRPVEETSWTTSWSPLHAGDSDISRNINRTLIYNGDDINISDIPVLVDESLPASSFEIVQTYENYNNADVDGTKKMWDGEVRHYLGKDGEIYVDHTITVSRDLYCSIGYPLMMATSPGVGDTLTLGDGRKLIVGEYGSNYLSDVIVESAMWQKTDVRSACAVEVIDPERSWLANVQDYKGHTVTRTASASKFYNRALSDVVIPGGTVMHFTHRYVCKVY